MERLTAERMNGIKAGYWSASKKEELVQRLAKYEDTGLTPEQITQLDKIYLEKCQEVNELRAQLPKWIPVEERLPETDEYILLSFANFSLPIVGRYEADGDGSGTFYLGDCNEEDTCINQDLIVNAWMPLPKPYRG